MRRLALAATLLLAAAALAGVGRPEGAHAVDSAPAPSDSTDSVTVSGAGSVSATPTTAVVSFGVDTRGTTAKAALAANAKEMRQVIDALKAAGASDVTTQWVSLSQSSDQNGQPNGFQASNSVGAKTGVDRAGALIDAAVEAGANRIDGPSMSVADQDALYRKALRAAMENARLSAETLAQSAGRALGKVTSVSESSQGLPIPYAAKAADSAGTPIEAGTQEVTASVTVTYALGG
jgi:uncharacterized protein